MKIFLFKFPLCYIFSIIIYVLGAVILTGFGIIVSALYFIYCFGVEILVILRSCKNCYYYDKVCGLCKEKIADLFIKLGDSKKFTDRKVISLIYFLIFFYFPYC